MTIIILSAQHKERTLKSGIFRVDEVLRRAGTEVVYYCVSNNILHQLFRTDRCFLKGEVKQIYN